MSASMPEQPKFVKLDPKWKAKGFHTTILVNWESFVEILKAQNCIKETDNVSAVYVYGHGIVLDLR